MLNSLAHLKWFTTEEPVNIKGFNTAELVFALLIVVAGLVVLKFIDSYLKKSGITKKIDNKLIRFREWAPLVVRLSTAIFLMNNFYSKFLLAPNVTNSSSTIADIIGLIFIISAILLVLGLFTRAGAVLLLSGYFLVVFGNDFVDILEHFEYVGIAGYLWFRGPGKYSLDYLRLDEDFKLPVNSKYSLDIYRVSIGIGLAVLALSEKLFNVSAAQEFLLHYNWNLLSSFGVTDRYFILIAGAIELLVGMALILNLAPRIIVTTVLGLMIITAILLGIEEVYGHLFAVGVVAIIWINDYNPARK